MYDSIILRSIARLMLPLLLTLAVVMLLRGHNLPGGGFIGGLVASCGLILQMIAFGPTFVRRVLPANYLAMAAFGVFFAGLWGLPALLGSQPFLTAVWLPDPIPGVGKIGSPVLFDLGVFVAVIGVTTQIALLLSEEPLLFPMRHEAATDDEGVPLA